MLFLRNPENNLMELVPGHRGGQGACPFTLQDLLEARVLVGYGYREMWPCVTWTIRMKDEVKDEQRTVRNLLQNWQDALAWASGRHHDNHQTFLLEVKYRQGGSRNIQPWYVMFHDSSVWVGEYIHRQGG